MSHACLSKLFPDRLRNGCALGFGAAVPGFGSLFPLKKNTGPDIVRNGALWSTWLNLWNFNGQQLVEFWSDFDSVYGFVRRITKSLIWIFFFFFKMAEKFKRCNENGVFWFFVNKWESYTAIWTLFEAWWAQGRNLSFPCILFEIGWKLHTWEGFDFCVFHFSTKISYESCTLICNLFTHSCRQLRSVSFVLFFFPNGAKLQMVARDFRFWPFLALKGP